MMNMKKRKKQDEEGGEEDEADDDEEGEEGEEEEAEEEAEEEEEEEEEEVEKEEEVEVETGFALDGAPYPKRWEFVGQEAGWNNKKRFDPSSHTDASENDPDFLRSRKWPSKGTIADREKGTPQRGTSLVSGLQVLSWFMIPFSILCPRPVKNKLVVWGM